MIVTGEKFKTIGEALFGERWVSAVAHALEKDQRTVRRYSDGEINVPRDVRKLLAIICQTRGAALVRLSIELDPSVSGVAPAITAATSDGPAQ